MWDPGAIVEWVASLGIRPGGLVDVEMVDVGQVQMPVPAMPDRLALVYPVPGTGESHEGVFDTPGFQLRLRWDPNDPIGAHRAAKTADRLIRFSGFPCWAGRPSEPVWLVRVMRSGGPPTELSSSRADGDRTTLTSTYLTQVGEYAHEELI